MINGYYYNIYIYTLWIQVPSQPVFGYIYIYIPSGYLKQTDEAPIYTMWGPQL